MISKIVRKLSLFVIFAIIFQSSFAQVKEYWEASFTPSLKGNYRYSQEGSLLIVGINIEKIQKDYLLEN